MLSHKAMALTSSAEQSLGDVNCNPSVELASLGLGWVSIATLDVTKALLERSITGHTIEFELSCTGSWTTFPLLEAHSTQAQSIEVDADHCSLLSQRYPKHRVERRVHLWLFCSANTISGRRR